MCMVCQKTASFTMLSMEKSGISEEYENDYA